MKRNASAKQYTSDSEFGNLMTKDQIDERFEVLQKQFSNRTLKRRNTVTVRQSKVEDICQLFEKIIKKSSKTKPLKPQYQQVCQDFGIDFNILRKIQTVEQKQDFIIQCSVSQISRQFDNIFQKYQSSTHNEDSFNAKQNQLDLYGWLQVKSQYKSILKRLKFALVDLIQTTENFRKVNNFLATKSKINSPQVSFIHTTNLESKEQSTQYTSRIQQNNDKKLNLKIPDFQYQQPDIFFEWNKAIEEGYLETGKNIHLFGYETIKKQLANGVHYKKREKILSKCQQTGNYITEEELQYIASTSFLINKCIDRDFIQRAINCLEDNVKDQIEYNISEQILKNFYFLKDNQYKCRNKYFEEQNIEKREKIQQNTKNYERHKHFSKDSLQMRVIKGKFVQFLKEAQKKKFLRDKFNQKKKSTLQKLRSSGNPLANIYVQKFKEIMMNIVRRFRDRKGTERIKKMNFLERNQQKQSFKPLFVKGQDDMKLDKVKHLFHPPSKLFSMDPEEKNIQYKKDNLIKQSKNYRLGIRNYDITQNEFQTFYSGGPQSCRLFQSPKLKIINEQEGSDNAQQKKTWINEEIEIQAINKIKMAIKRYLYRKKFFKVIEKKEQLKSIDIEKKIQQCMKAKRFFEELHKELNKQQNDRLKDISTHSPPKLPISQMERMVQFPSSTPTSPQIQRISRHKTTEISLATSRIVRQVDLQKRETNEKQRQKLLNKFVRSRLDRESKIKNRKLIQAAKMKNISIADAAGFHYTKQDTEFYDSNGNTPLYYSAKYGDEQMTKMLLKIGADVNQICSNGNTPLHMAFLSGHAQIIIEFIHRGGNLNILNNDGFTPLAYGTQDLLKSLNLLNCVATVKPETVKRSDNMQIIHRKIKSENYVIDDELISEFRKKK